MDSNQVFTISKWGNVFCFDAAKGTVLWEHDLGQDGVRSNRWGFAGSPLIWNDLVIFNAGTTGLALDRHTGHLAWSTGTNTTGYASPVLVHSGNRDQVLIFAAKFLVALDPKTGHELWRRRWETSWDTNITDPLIHPKGIFISSFSRGCALLALRNDKPEDIYASKVLNSHLSPGVLLGDYLYAFNGEAKMDTDFRCIHLPTGDLKWTTKDPRFGSLICASRRLIILSEQGELLLADPSPSGFKPLARAKVIDGVCWASPALANGLLYVRNAKGAVVCVDLR
jgi:outer membrane protein assembly factor BamB